MIERRIFDPGLQPERTALAWRRTVLALLVGSATSLRLLPPVFGPWSLAIGVAGLLISGALWAISTAPARRTEQALLTGRPLPGAVPIALTAGLAASAAAICLVYVAVR